MQQLRLDVRWKFSKTSVKKLEEVPYLQTYASSGVDGIPTAAIRANNGMYAGALLELHDQACTEPQLHHDFNHAKLVVVRKKFSNPEPDNMLVSADRLRHISVLSYSHKLIFAAIAHPLAMAAQATTLDSRRGGGLRGRQMIDIAVDTEALGLLVCRLAHYILAIF